MCAAAADPSMFSPGQEFGGYVIEKRLGAGGFGEVFLAREHSPQRQVALKFVRPEFAADPTFVRRFEREANAMAAVEHPNVVPIYAHPQGLGYFSMRYVRGGSLAALLEEREVPLADILELLAGVAEGLDYCHAQGIVHRDLKPANVLIDTARGEGLLTDFGIALTEDGTTLTGPGRSPGTPAYMAPETLMGGRATAASDLWALGAVAYRAATDAFPRGLSQPAETEPVPPSHRNERLGPEVDRVLLRALAFDPVRRYPSATAFVSDLREALERPARHRPRRPPAEAPTQRVELPRLHSARRMWSVAGAALVLIPTLAYGVSSFTGTDCHSSYTGACLKADSDDYDCRRGGGDGPDYVDGTVRVVGRDDFRLDADGDGRAC